MKKWYTRGLLVSALTAAALVTGTQALASHADATSVPITLKDANGNVIAPGSTAAYSAKETCGGCHDYNAMERHSYHAQLGANQYLGWNAWAMGNWNSIATKGKPWVQSPGHVGKW